MYNINKQKIIEEYWINKLDGFKSEILLPKFINECNKIKNNIEVKFPEKLTKKLYSLSNNSDLGLFILVMVSFKLTLKFYTGIDDILILIPSFKNKSKEESLIFYRYIFKDNIPLIEFIDETKAQILRDYSYSTYNLNDFYNVYFEKYNHDCKDFFNIALSYDKLHQNITNLENLNLNAYLNEENGTLKFKIEYNSKLYSEETITFFCDTFIETLEKIEECKDFLIDDVLHLCKKELNKIDSFNDNIKFFPKKSLYSLIQEQLINNGLSIALVHDNERITYQQLNNKIDMMANKLLKSGVNSKMKVAVLSKTCIDYVVSILAILKIGAIYVPINIDDTTTRIDYILKDCQAKYVICDTTINRNFNKTIKKIDIHNYIVKETFITVEPSIDDTAYIMYTSGSTGNPKGTIISHSSIVNQLYNLKERYIHLRGTRHILLAPMTFDPSLQQILWPLLLGGTLYLIEDLVKQNPQLLIKYLINHKIDVINTVPSLMSLLVRYSDPYRDHSFKMIILAGETFSTSLFAKIKETFRVDKIINIYGPTEATINTTLYECENVISSINVPIGKPIENYNVFILDKNLKKVPIGVIGELCISGIGLAKGYLNNEKLTSEKFIENPFEKGKRLYKTGDLGRWLPDGNIEFIGRDDNQIKINGIRIELGEIEKQLLLHNEINEAVVMDLNKEILVAFVVTTSRLNIQELRQYIIQLLPSYMVPSTFIKVESIPLTNNGKINRDALIRIYLDNKKNSTLVLPENEVEKTILDLCKSVLDVQELGMLDNFYEHGGNSLKIIILVSEIHKKFGVKLDVQSIFKCQTIRDIKELMLSSKTSTFEHIKKIQEQEYYNLTHNQKRMWIMEQTKGNLRHNICTAKLLYGAVNVDILSKAINQIVHRHESFRTTFLEINGEVKQRIKKYLHIPLIYIDLSDYNSPKDKAREIVENESSFTFNLYTGPLLKAKLIKIKEQEHVLLFVMHHIISDTWSMGIFFNELLTIYSNLANNEEKKLPDINIQYKDYVYWLDEYLSGALLNDNRNYWKNQLSGLNNQTTLPSLYSRKISSNNDAGINVYELEENIVESINTIMKEKNMTLFMVFFAIFSIFIYKSTNYRDVIINCLIAGRNHKDTENIIGFFVNTLPIRLSILKDNTFNDILYNSKNVMIGAYEHQLYSYDQIIEDANIQKIDNRSFLSDVDFSVVESLYNVDINNLQNLRINDFDYLSHEDKKISSDIFFEFIRINNKKIKMKIKYKVDLFNSSHIDLMQNRFINLTKVLLKKSDIKLSDLDISTNENEKDVNLDFYFDDEEME